MVTSEEELQQSLRVSIIFLTATVVCFKVCLFAFILEQTNVLYETVMINTLYHIDDLNQYLLDLYKMLRT